MTTETQPTNDLAGALAEVYPNSSITCIDGTHADCAMNGCACECHPEEAPNSATIVVNGYDAKGEAEAFDVEPAVQVSMPGMPAPVEPLWPRIDGHAIADDHARLVAAMSECVHRWRIAEPGGPTSDGRCTRCGAVQPFANSHPHDRDWTISIAHKRRGGEATRKQHTMRDLVVNGRASLEYFNNAGGEAS